MVAIMKSPLNVLALIAVAAPLACAQSSDWVAKFANNYSVQANIVYGVENNYENKLDLYERKNATIPGPVLVYIHGGGWTGGSKEGGFNKVLPYLEQGWNVVNVEYRLARVSLAPAAVEDCICALKWVGIHAAEHHIDANRIVVTGDSAGGHLALMVGMTPESAGLDRECAGHPLPKVAAIVDWYGITDVNDLLSGDNMKTYAVQWLGSLPNREDVARRVSPMQYVRAGLPPTLMIQGDADPTVPYQHSVKLHAALDKAGVPNQLLTIPGGKHGNFTDDEYVKAYATIWQFLGAHGLTVKQ
jgi:acetyl esterase/lipase